MEGCLQMPGASARAPIDATFQGLSIATFNEPKDRHHTTQDSTIRIIDLFDQLKLESSTEALSKTFR